MKRLLNVMYDNPVGTVVVAMFILFIGAFMLVKAVTPSNDSAIHYCKDNIHETCARECVCTAMLCHSNQTYKPLNSE